ncbi:ABC transporter permease [Roseomonas stagni]|uniref:ABC transporter permease n=1 Tax=Falsiroseomonas algicola TaxID=2716930 RepID=A0A6M1LRK1_9PROT|nr:ABC transporter permease [Falsiroseomonas algicola]NGM23058.1 ABC transporter permease [Falsiroseomonas algicola]
MREVWRALTRRSGWLGLLGATLLVVLVLLAIFGPWLDLPDPTRTNLRARMVAPTLSWFSLGAHPLGTDQLGRDILSRIIAGSRVTLMVAGAAVLLGGVLGTLLGLISGYFGGWVDRILMRLVDIQLALPLMLLALMVVAALGPSLRNLVGVLALVSWVRYARIVRGQVLAVREREFVQSARAIGASHPRIILRHILPNVLTPALVVATLELARVIVLEAGLSFLGLGIQPPDPSWGRMLADGRTYISSAWWIITFPGLALMLTVLAVNLLGDWLRDFFDPRLAVR